MTSTSGTNEPTNNHRDNSNRKDGENNDKDWIDTVCETTSNMFCPVPENLPEAMAAMDEEKKQEEEDLLDSVFVAVESFTCKDDAPNNGTPTKEQSDRDADSEKDANNETPPEERIAPLGEEGDALDYVFEKVSL